MQEMWTALIPDDTKWECMRNLGNVKPTFLRWYEMKIAGGNKVGITKYTVPRWYELWITGKEYKKCQMIWNVNRRERKQERSDYMKCESQGKNAGNARWYEMWIEGKELRKCQMIWNENCMCKNARNVKNRIPRWYKMKNEGWRMQKIPYAQFWDEMKWELQGKECRKFQVWSCHMIWI